MSDENTRGNLPVGGSGQGSQPPYGTGPGYRTGTGRGTTRRKEAERQRALTTFALVDVAALVVMLGAVAVGFGPVWGSLGYLLPTVGGAVVGLGVAWVGAWRRFPAVVVTALAVLAYILFGGALALPHTTIAGVVPTLDTLRELLLGAVQGWKQFITTEAPMRSFPDLGVVPFLLMFVVALIAGTISWRAKHAVWALVPVIVGLVGVILLGTLDAALPIVQGLVISIVALLWGAVRVMEARVGTHSISTEASREATRRLRWYRVRTGATILTAAALAAGFTAPILMPDQDRMVLRETVVPPFDVHQFKSPLVAFRHYVKDAREEELFTVSDLPEGGRVRLATLDRYDGVVFDADGNGGDTGVYTRVGEEIATSSDDTPTAIDVTIEGYSGVWVPEIGNLTGVRWSGANAQAQTDGTYYNSTTSTAITTAGLNRGDTYTFNTLVPEAPDEDTLKKTRILPADLPETDAAAMPPGLPAKAMQFTGDETDPATKLFQIRDSLQANGVLSSGLENQAPSRPGHSAERIDTLVQQEDPIGDDEQFAVALALMARQAGIPARVVMGFYPDKDNTTYKEGEPWTVLGSDVHAWIEVPFQGYGWVAVDAIPEKKPQVQPEPKTEEVPKPPVLQDPEPPEEPDKAKAGSVEDDEKDETENDPFDWGLLGLILLAVGIPLLVIAGPIIAILAYKARRRAARRSAEQLADRVSGGWHEVVDVVTDLGTSVPSGATRRESAGVIAGAHGVPSTLTLAHRADATVFGRGEPTPADVESFWTEVDELVGGLRSNLSTRQKVGAALSLRSVWARLGGRRGVLAALGELGSRRTKESR
ncbi:transglutaminase superfamily protein [Promicromonospora sp. AC04]|uniref:transglutaminase-like domain-containing protein n=1 Tax=Promicromonospora sp. AC04 TaxID=2135723 RepID=UPI000D39ACD2|nr:transglutaminase-like domain-containing protein [Promicromonospora sp. AC04]PUB30146.1 transglutaminase superfamily protein [Promicromonospora sp. AC04]